MLVIFKANTLLNYGTVNFPLFKYCKLFVLQCGFCFIEWHCYPQGILAVLELKLTISTEFWETCMCTWSSKSEIICGRRRLSRYEARENLKPGTISSVTAAPPTMCLFSKIHVRIPDFCKYAAAISPLWPAWQTHVFVVKGGGYEKITASPYW